ncbi:MAG TPA: flagellar biosynthetic protein FliR [Hyphomicrobium sp.]|nr:flagellar biosynthetic protein FliR [Hyphomicrobium sp.]
MSDELVLRLQVTAVVFARVSAFLAVVPVLSAVRVPALVRAHAAMVLALALSAYLYPSMSGVVTGSMDNGFMALVAAEVAKGLFLGFLVRLFFSAFAFAGDFASHLVGFTGMLVPSATDAEMAGPLGNVFVMFAAVVFFVNDLHLVLIEKLAASYQTLPPGTGLDQFRTLEWLSATLTEVFMMALQLSAPFVIYVMVGNVLLGLANRLIPQVPIQLVSAPALLAGGLFVAMFTLALAIQVFLEALVKFLSVH